VQWGDGLCGCGSAPDSPIGLSYGKRPGPRHEAFGGAEALLDLLPPDIPAVKTQATGPVTMAMGMLAAGHPGKGLQRCVVDGLVRRLEAHLVRIERSLPHADVTVILDEPALGGLLTAGFPFSTDEATHLLGATIARAPVPAGVHCCEDTDWSVVANAQPAWISWDLASLGTGLAESLPQVAAALGRGTRVVWGLVPARAGSPWPDPTDRLNSVIGELVVAGADMESLVTRALFSPSCGLAGLSVGQAGAVSEQVARLAGELASG
jgi:hypothetical protein